MRNFKELEERNIVHRDINPEDIIVSTDVKIYFSDFGIARRMPNAPSLKKTEAINYLDILSTNSNNSPGQPSY